MAPCRYGHTEGRNRWGGCITCKRASNQVSTRLRRGDRWTDPMDPPEDRKRSWAAYCARLDASIAQTRQHEGFDGTTWTWFTLGDPRTFVPVVADDELRRAS